MWKRPVAWAAAVVGTALTTTAVSLVNDPLNQVTRRVTETGTAVRVDHVREIRTDTFANNVIFPKDTVFQEQDLAELNAVRDADESSTEWLEARGGVAANVVFVELAVSGNRQDPVRITDMDVKRECGPPLDGLFFEDPPAGAGESVRIHLHLDEPDPTARLLTDETKLFAPEEWGETYFPKYTISLKKKEQQVIVVAATTEAQYCEFFIDMTILARGEVEIERVAMPDGSPFQVSASLPPERYSAVYLGGVTCPRWVRAGPAYFSDVNVDPCGGNP